MGNLIEFPRPMNPTPEQTDYFRMQAAYWSEVEEVSYRQYEYAKDQREHYLRCLGMLAVVKGSPE